MGTPRKCPLNFSYSLARYDTPLHSLTASRNRHQGSGSFLEISGVCAIQCIQYALPAYIDGYQGLDAAENADASSPPWHVCNIKLAAWIILKVPKFWSVHKKYQISFARCCGQWFLWPLEVLVILFDGFDYYQIFQQGIPTILDQTSHEHPPLSSLAWPCLFNILSLSHSWTFACTDDGWLYISFAYRIHLEVQHPTWEPR